MVTFPIMAKATTVLVYTEGVMVEEESESERYKATTAITTSITTSTITPTDNTLTCRDET